MRPRIGITSSFVADASRQPPREKLYLNAAYTDAVVAAGGLPVPLPVPAQPETALLDDLLQIVDGLIFTGGEDLEPRQYGQVRHPRTDTMHSRRDAFEVEFFRRADTARVPIFAICLGSQVAHVARGGQLVQHLEDLQLQPLTHHRAVHWRGAFHPVRIEPDARLAAIVGGTELETNSRHHQAVDRARPGRGLRSVAYSPDGLLEASEDMSDGRFLLAVQWHPEDLVDRTEHLRLFEALVDAAAAQRRA
jgi:putative glutamine amidotransferase